MSKKIRQRIDGNGTVSTFTTGHPRGYAGNFDVAITSPPRHFKKSTEMTVEFGDGSYLQLDGRQARTLSEVLSRHFEEVE